MAALNAVAPVAIPSSVEIGGPSAAKASDNGNPKLAPTDIGFGCSGCNEIVVEMFAFVRAVTALA